MKKKWLTLVSVSAVLTSMLSGCSENTNSSTNKGDVTGEPITLTVLNAADDGIRDKFFADVIKPQFEKENPGIKLEVITTPFEDFDSKFSTLVAGGTPPDVWSHWGESGFVDYMTRGLTLDLTPYMKDFNNSNIPDASMKIYNIDGKQYGIPFSIFPSLVFYNKDAVKAAGLDLPDYKYGDPAWTWDKLVELAKKVTKNYGKPDAVYGFTWNMGSHMATYSWDWGLDIFKDAYSTGYLEKADLTDPKFVSAVQFTQDLIFKDKITPTQAVNDAISKTGDPDLTGKVVFDLNGGWQMSGFKDAKFNFGVEPMPLGPAGTSTPMVYTDPLMISSKSKHPDAAWKLVKFLTSPDMQKTFATTTGYPPSDSKAYTEWLKQFSDTVDLNYLTSVVNDSIANGKESPNHLIAGYGEISPFMQNEQQPIYVNDADPAAELPQISERFNKLLEDIKAKSSSK